MSVIKLPGIPTGTIDGFTSDTHRRVKWLPRGPLTLVASTDALAESLPKEIAANPTRVLAKQMWRDPGKPAAKQSARLFVGFNVGDRQEWSQEDVYKVAYLLREKQLSDTGSLAAFSFYAGLGAFPGVSGKVVTEKSAQIVFMNFRQKAEEFFDDMIDLAADMANYLHQESVLLEISKSGKVFYLEYVDSEHRKPVQGTRKFIEKADARFEGLR